MPTRYVLKIQYDGGPFSGWQEQKDAPSIQQTICQAIKNLTGESVILYGAGRTDKGVHASEQIAHFSLNTPKKTYTLFRGLNFYLHKTTIRICKVSQAPEEFHARFSAISRRYTYKILNQDELDPLWFQKAWWIFSPLDYPAMAMASQIFRGTHDFDHFRHKNCQSQSSIKTIDDFRMEFHPPFLEIHIKALSFLHRQVRMMVGGLVAVGKHKLSIEQLQSILKRQAPYTAPIAPAHGLYLSKVEYPFPIFS